MDAESREEGGSASPSETKKGKGGKYGRMDCRGTKASSGERE
jgi:hypothetical protein